MPPDRERGGRLSPETARHQPHSQPALTKTSSHPHDNPPRPHLGRYATGWRHGFRAGAIVALRLAGRRLPPAAWNVLDELADAYELAVSDE